jgi:hypothetical protein
LARYTASRLYPFAQLRKTHRPWPDRDASVDSSPQEQTLTESHSSVVAAADKRRSTRVDYVARILVRGTDALSQAFKESTTTVGVNCYGCQYQSKHYVQKNSVVILEIPQRDLKLPPRILRGRVVWVQRPRTFRNLYLIGIEFDVPGNVWDIQSPPKDWFPHPEDEELVIPVYPKAGEPAEPTRSSSIAGAGQPETDALGAAPSLRSLDKIVEAAVSREMERMCRQLDTQLHEAIEGAVKGLIERVTDAALETLTRPTTSHSVTAEEQAAQASHAKRRRKAPKQKI